MKKSNSTTETEESLKTTYCQTDKLHYVYLNEEVIHYQQTKPNNDDLLSAYTSDQWEPRFDDMRAGERVRVSQRIFDEMLGAVPPKRFTGSSFYCGECYSGNLYYYFEKVDGICYGCLKPISQKTELN